MLLKAGDPAGDDCAAIHLGGDSAVLGAWQVAQLAALPFDAHRVAIMGIVRLSHQSQNVTDPQFCPKFPARVVLEAGQRRTLHQDLDGLGVYGAGDKE